MPRKPANVKVEEEGEPKAPRTKSKTKEVKIESNSPTTVIDFPTTTIITTQTLHQDDTKGAKKRRNEESAKSASKSASKQPAMADSQAITRSTKSDRTAQAKMIKGSTKQLRQGRQTMIDSESEEEDVTMLASDANAGVDSEIDEEELFLAHQGINFDDFQGDEGEMIEMYGFGEEDEDPTLDSFDFYKDDIIDGEDEEDNSASDETSLEPTESSEKVSTLTELMNSGHSLTVQQKNIDKANIVGKIELELSLEDIDTLANDFADAFITMVNEHMSAYVSQTLMAADENENVGGALKQYSRGYTKQTFNDFEAGKMDLNMDLQSFTKEDLSLNTSIISKKMTKDHSLNIDKIVNKIDLVAQHIGSKRDDHRQRSKKKRDLKAKGQKATQWFDLPKTKLTKGMQEAWAVLQNKAQLTTGNQFIRVEKSAMPEYSQVGTIIDGDYSGLARLTNKQKKRTLTEQFLDEARQSGEVKKRFRQQQQKAREQYGTGTQYSGVGSKFRKYTKKG